MAATPPARHLPTIKFFKDAVEDILQGHKTLEPRPRSEAWIRRLEAAGAAWLTVGPRFGAPRTFATARIVDISLRPFDTVTEDDLARIGTPWQGRPTEEFVEEYTRWFRKELDKGYPVAWIDFRVVHEEPDLPDV